MGLPQFKASCAIFDLKTCCIIMGSINAVLSFVLLWVMMCVFVTTINQDKTDLSSDDIALEAVGSILYALLFCFKFVFDVYFVWGVSVERPSVLKVYMIMWVVFVLLAMFVFYLNMPDFNPGIVLTEIIYIVHSVYTILLSKSFYNQLVSVFV